MKAIILAAGQGTRLKKYTENLPKGMLSFLGKTIIERQIEAYRTCGIENIIVVKGFAAEKIAYPNVKYYVNENYATTNMVESFMTARDDFCDDVIVSYSDILFEKGMLKKMMTVDGDFCVAVDDNWKDYWKKRYGKIDFDIESLTIDGGGLITELGSENADIERISSRYIGLLKFSKNGLGIISKVLEDAYKFYKDKPWQQSGKPVRSAYMTDLLNALIEKGYDVQAVRFENGWIEFDTNEDYENALSWAKDNSLKDLISL